jgi:ankyrin repeat protein
MKEFIVQGWFTNGAYERVGIAINTTLESGNLQVLQKALSRVHNLPDRYGKSNLNAHKINTDGISRTIFQVAIDAFLQPNLSSIQRTTAIKIIEELIASDKIDTNTPIIKNALNNAISIIKANPELKEYVPKFEVILIKLGEQNLDLTPDYIIQKLAEEVDNFSKEHTDELIKYYKSHKEQFANKLLVSDADLKKAFIMEDKYLFKALVETCQVNLNANVQETSILTWWGYNKTAFMAAIELGCGEAMLSSDSFTPWDTIPSPIKQLYTISKDPKLFGLLLQKENSLSASDLKTFLSTSINDNHPQIAMLLMEYYYKNETALKNEIGKELLSAEDLFKVNQQSQDKDWKALGILIQTSGAIKLDKQQVLVKGRIRNSKLEGLDPFFNNLTPASLKIAMENGDLSLESLSKTDQDKLAKIISQSNSKQFEQYIGTLPTSNEKLQPFINKIVALSHKKSSHLDILADKDLISGFLKGTSAIQMYRDGQIGLLEKLINKKLINLTEVDKDGNTILHHVLANGHYNLAHAIIAEVGEEKINGKPIIQASNKIGFTPLLYLLKQPYSDYKKPVMAAIMGHDRFKYSNERTGDKVLHILNSFQDKETVIDYLNNLIQITTKQKNKQERLQNFFNQALLTNNTMVVKAMLDNFSDKLDLNDIKYTDAKGNKKTGIPLFIAYMNGNVELIDSLLKNSRLNINKIGPNGITLFHQAAYDGQNDVVKLALGQPSLRSDFVTGNNKHPLLDVLNVIHALETKDSLTKLEQQRLENLRQIVITLSSSEKVDINCRDTKGNTPIIIIYSRLQEIELRIKQLEQVNETKPQDWSNWTQDAAASAKDYFTGATRELDRLKVYKENLELQFDIISKNSLINVLHQNNTNETLVTLAIKSSDITTLRNISTTVDKSREKELSQAFNQVDGNNNTPIMHAYASGNSDVATITTLHALKFLEDEEQKKAVYDTKNKDGQTLLIAACKGGNLELVKDALNKQTDKDISSGDKLGNTPLHHATSKPEILEFLLEKDEGNKALNSQNSQGQTPLIKAVLEGDFATIELLLEKGADVNIPDKNGNTPLMYACILENKNVINRLLESPEIDVRAVSNIGATAYMYSALKGSLEQSQGEGIKKDQAWKGDPAILQNLIAKGADPFFGTYYKSLTQKMMGIATEAFGFSILGSATSKLLGSDSLLYQGVKAAAAAKVALSTYKAVSSSVEKNITEFLSGDGSQGGNINLSEQCMIGAMSLGRLGIVYRGRSLKNALLKQNNFDKDGVNKAIYNIEDLKDAMEKLGHEPKDIAKKAEYHEVLQARYVRIKTTLDNKFIPFWTRIPLNKMLKEILEADKIVSAEFTTKQEADKPQTSITDILSKTLSVLKPKNRDRFIIAMLNEPNKEKFAEFNNLLESIRKKEFFVPADVMYNIIQFKKRSIELAQQQKKPNLFRRIVGFDFGRKRNISLENEVIQETKNSDLDLYKVTIEKTNKSEEKPKSDNKNVASNSTGAAIHMIGKLTGQEPKQVVDGIAKACGKAAGAGSAAVAFTAMDFDHAYKIYQLSSVATNAALAAANTAWDVGSGVFNVVSKADPLKIAIGAFGVAAAVGGYLYFQSKSDKAKKQSEAAAPFNPKSLADLSDPLCSPEVAKNFIAQANNDLKLSNESNQKVDLTRSSSTSSLSSLTESTELPNTVAQLPTTRYEYAQQVLAATSVAAYILPAKAKVNTPNITPSISRTQSEHDLNANVPH